MKSKYKNLVALSTHLIRLEVIRGPDRWRVTELSRSSRFARSRIYEVLGKNKTEMLENALAAVLDELYGLSPERVEFELSQGVVQGFHRSRQLVMDHPELLAFYFRNRRRQDKVGEIIRTKEKKYLEKVTNRTPNNDATYILFVRTMIHGISLAPFLEDSDIEPLLKMLSSISFAE